MLEGFQVKTGLHNEEKIQPRGACCERRESTEFAHEFP